MEGIASSSMPVSVISVKPSLQGVTESWEESTKEVSTGEYIQQPLRSWEGKKRKLPLTLPLELKDVFSCLCPPLKFLCNWIDDG